MEPATIITTLSKLIGLGMALHKAHRSEGFDRDDVDALKTFLDSGAGFLSRKVKDDKPVGAIQLALVVQSFGAAMGQHWANNAKMVPGKSKLPEWVRKIFDQPTAKRYEEIELRMKHADLKLLAPESKSDPSDELRLLRQLTSRADDSPYYRALWDAFTNPKLKEEGIEPPLSLEKDGDAREFERYFRLAYARALATPAGRQVQQWQIELSDEKPRALQHALMLDMAGWGRRHVFGNSLVHAENDILPFMPLDDVYVEPLGRLVKEPRTEDAELIPIKTLVRGLLEQHHMVVVRADFGHGKSLTARGLAKDFATEWLADNRAMGVQLTVPVFIKCTRDLKETSYEHAKAVRRARWEHAIDALGVDRPLADEIFAPIEQQETLFILDGLDEISYSFILLRELFQRLDETARGSHRAVIFTRPGALGHDCLPKGTPVVDLLPFQSRDQIEAWIHGWNGIVGADRRLGWEQVEKTGLGELARTPILLLMIAMTVEELRGRQEKTVDKTVLYERFFSHIARGKLEQDRGEQHQPIVEASERLRERLVAEGILPEDAQPVQAMLWLMSRIAWRAHDHAYRPDGPPLSVKDVDVKILGDELKLKEDVRRAVEVGLILAMQMNPAGDSKDILFGHQSFREFLVARYWCHELRRLVGGRGRRRRDDSIVSHLMEARLLQQGDAAFSMLSSMLERLTDGHDDDRRRIHEWAQEVSNDDELSSRNLREDRSSFLRESALAIGSSISPVELYDPMTLRSLLAVYYAQGGYLLLAAPNLISPGADLIGADLSGSNLSGSNLSGSNLSGSNLSNVDLSGSNLSDADLSDADLSGAHLSDANLIGVDLSGSNLSGADLSGSHLSDANLSGAHLISTHLNHAYLTQANLSGADLMSANLTNADLMNANLTSAHLNHANLTNANLTNANLTNADLTNANLTNAHLNHANLTNARYTSRTRWPEGFQVEPSGAILVS